MVDLPDLYAHCLSVARRLITGVVLMVMIVAHILYIALRSVTGRYLLRSFVFTFSYIKMRIPVNHVWGDEV